MNDCKDAIDKFLYDPVNGIAMDLCTWVALDPFDQCQRDCPCPEKDRMKNKYLCPVTCGICGEDQSLIPATYLVPTPNFSSFPTTLYVSTLNDCEDNIDKSFYDVASDIVIDLCRWVALDPVTRCEMECPCEAEERKINKYLCPKTCGMCLESPSFLPSPFSTDTLTMNPASSPSSIPSNEPSRYPSSRPSKRP